MKKIIKLSKNDNLLIMFCLLISINQGICQNAARIKDTNTPLHALQPDYPVPYGNRAPLEIKEVLDRVYSYLDSTTPARLIDSITDKEVTDYKKINEHTEIMRGDFRIISYEWGVTYAGMLLVGEVTGDKKYTGYTNQRLKFIAEIIPYYRSLLEKNPDEQKIGRAHV